MKNFLAMVLTIALMLSLCPMGAFSVTVNAAGNITEFAGGSGTTDDPYLIATKEHLNNVRNYLDAHFKMTADITLPDTHWSPIGDYSAAFKGVFDGDGHVIKNLHVNASGYAGLFGYVQNVTIENFGIVGGQITTESDYCVGGIVGRADDSTITNCYNTATIDGKSSFSGGIVGRMGGGTIAKCYNTKTVSAGYAGGIVGYLDEGGTIMNCYNTGAIFATGNAGGIIANLVGGTIMNCYNTGVISSDWSTGHIVGFKDSGNVTNCYYLSNRSNGAGPACTLDQMQQQATYVGFDFDSVWAIDSNAQYSFPTLRDNPHFLYQNTTEFAGGSGVFYNPYLISTKEQLNNVRNYLDAYFKLTTDIEFTVADFAEDGAFYNNGASWLPIGSESAPFAGLFDGDGHVIKNLQVNASGYAGLFGYTQNATIQNVGIVVGQFTATPGLVKLEGGCYSSFAGGIVGYADGSTITYCYNSGAVEATPTDSLPGYYSYAGGIAGYIGGGTITNCYNTGAVAATDDGCYVYAGGVAGGVGGTITNCYNTGAVSATTSYCDAYAGGVAGIVYRGIITNCYNRAAIVATNSLVYGFYAGGVAGWVYDSTNTTNCYYLNNLSQGVGKGTDTCTKCSLEQMQQQATYVGFDFDAVWKMGTNEGHLCPELRENPHITEKQNLESFGVVMNGLGLHFPKDVAATKGNVDGIRFGTKLDFGSGYTTKNDVLCLPYNNEYYEVVSMGAVLRRHEDGIELTVENARWKSEAYNNTENKLRCVEFNENYVVFAVNMMTKEPSTAFNARKYDALGYVQLNIDGVITTIYTDVVTDSVDEAFARTMKFDIIVSENGEDVYDDF